MFWFKQYFAVGLLLMVSLVAIANSQQSVTITGTVVDSVTSAGIANARVALLEVPSCTTLTDATGAFSLSTLTTRTVDPRLAATVSGQIALRSGVLSIAGQEAGAKVSVDAFAVNGTLVAHREKSASSTGTVAFEPLRGALALYSYRVKVGSKMYTLSNLGSNAMVHTESSASNELNKPAKASAGAYTIMASKPDYIWKQVGMTSTVGSTGLIRLSSCHCADVSTANGWQKINPPGDNGDAQDNTIDPFSTGTLYVMMHKGGNGAHYPTDGIYKSTNCGSTWNKVPQGRNASDPGTNVFSGSFASLIIDHVDPKIFYAVSNYGPGGVWKSTNCGVDWDQMVPNGAGQIGQYVNMLWFNALAMDPTNHLHLAAANHMGCNGPYDPNAVAETRDGGVTWELLTLPIGWAEGNSVCIKDSATMLFTTFQNGMYVTTDAGKSWNKAADGADQEVYQSANGTYYLASCYGLLKSTDYKKWDVVCGGNFLNMIGTGKNLIGSGWWAFSFTIASETNPTTWVPLNVPNIPTTSDGGVYMSYEKYNHLVYSSHFAGGLWRLVHE